MQDNHAQKKAWKQRSPGDEFGLAQLFWYSWRNWRKNSHVYEEEIAELQHCLKTEQEHGGSGKQRRELYIDRGRHVLVGY